MARSIRAVLADERLTQEWLAEASGIPMRTLARRLHVRQPSAMSIEELARISAALDVDIADLLDERRLSARRLRSRSQPPT
ncbi:MULTISPECIES: helix-turn-helix transcriptional regulator [Microbacterium]|uniref:Helix-turn-helix domain-containing protein n=1 Tax=Microbacterium plantarum TaxID=1816425 RepID=A0ABV5EUB7_9MICO|nr:MULTISPECIES: helix-turn-helix transcriptional regulator [Microbacterium]WRK16278.1 helix-turn-helix transcriptional regulator [Microbacterium plantarum]